MTRVNLTLYSSDSLLSFESICNRNVTTRKALRLQLTDLSELRMEGMDEMLVQTAYIDDSHLLLTFTQFTSARIVGSEQSHDAVNNLVSPSDTHTLTLRSRITKSRKSLSSAKRIEHSLMSSICMLRVRTSH